MAVARWRTGRSGEAGRRLREMRKRPWYAPADPECGMLIFSVEGAKHARAYFSTVYPSFFSCNKHKK